MHIKDILRAMKKNGIQYKLARQVVGSFTFPVLIVRMDKKNNFFVQEPSKISQYDIDMLINICGRKKKWKKN